MRVCVVGAGSSGLATVKALADAGLSCDCFEASSVVGGLWVYDNPNGLSAAYRSLHINTSRDRMAFADFPMPDDYPDFPHHSLVARYLQAYAEHFGLLEHITLDTRVERAEPRASGFDVTLSTGETRAYDVLLVCNGHHWDPRWPEPRPPGTFEGLELHSHDYRSPTEPHDLVDKRVLVVGFGNSAMDIASELGLRTNAARVVLSTRRGGHVIPRYVLGRPLDTFGLSPRIPVRARAAFFAGVLRLSRGRMSAYGLPEPDFPLHASHPTISSDILDRLGSGDVVPRPGIAELQGDRVRFVDGSAEAIDAIVWCTGYRITFPFFDTGFLDPSDDNDVRLFHNVWLPGRRDVAFVGLVQPLGAVMPIAELQAKVIADWLAGRYRLPDAAAMRARIDRTVREMRRRYVASPRHTIQVDFDDYLIALRREWRRGRRRDAIRS